MYHASHEVVGPEHFMLLARRLLFQISLQHFMVHAAKMSVPCVQMLAFVSHVLDWCVIDRYSGGHVHAVWSRYVHIQVSQVTGLTPCSGSNIQVGDDISSLVAVMLAFQHFLAVAFCRDIPLYMHAENAGDKYSNCT